MSLILFGFLAGLGIGILLGWNAKWAGVLRADAKTGAANTELEREIKRLRAQVALHIGRES